MIAASADMTTEAAMIQVAGGSRRTCTERGVAAFFVGVLPPRQQHFPPVAGPPLSTHVSHHGCCPTALLPPIPLPDRRPPAPLFPRVQAIGRIPARQRQRRRPPLRACPGTLTTPVIATASQQRQQQRQQLPALPPLPTIISLGPIATLPLREPRTLAKRAKSRLPSAASTMWHQPLRVQA
jgi:hypothetical protein